MNDFAAVFALTQRSLAEQSRLYDEYGRGNRAAVLDALAEDVVWTSMAGPEIPWGGTHHGRAGVEEYFAKLDAVLRITGYAVEQVIPEGEWVTIMARGRARFLATGAELELPKVDIMRIRDGRILEFREYYDTATVLAALRPPAPRGGS
jgi:ketosteroid isomerase-like protein